MSTCGQIGRLPTPQWLPEIGQAKPTDLLFPNFLVSPKRIRGLVNISTQLLKQQAGPESDRILISDIFRQLAGCLDQVALYGGGPDANQPTGQSMLAASPKVLQSIRPIYTVRFVRLKAQIETAIRNGRGGCNPPE